MSIFLLKKAERNAIDRNLHPICISLKTNILWIRLLLQFVNGPFYIYNDIWPVNFVSQMGSFINDLQDSHNQKWFPNHLTGNDIRLWWKARDDLYLSYHNQVKTHTTSLNPNDDLLRIGHLPWITQESYRDDTNSNNGSFWPIVHRKVDCQ